MSIRSEKTALVLGGGGARGAYEAGVVAGLAELLGGSENEPLFRIFCGTSVGAINCAYLAANAHKRDFGAAGLVAHWEGLELDKHLKIDFAGLLGIRSLFTSRTGLGRSMLAIGALETLVGKGTPWQSLRRNIEGGLIEALVVTALEISSGRTTVFTDLAPGVSYEASRNPRRSSVATSVDENHVLASAAIPLIFPPRRIGAHHYVDGGIRFNTPLAPALRLGAERIVLVPLLTESPIATAHERKLGPFFLLGKILDALLLDPIDYDLQVLRRFNRIVDMLDEVLTKDERSRFDAAMIQERGEPYRAVDTLVFRPSEDLGQLARQRARAFSRGTKSERLLSRLAAMEDAMEADFLSFILFDGSHANQLIELGRRDVVSRRDEVFAFFEK